VDEGSPDGLPAIAADLHNEYCLAVEGTVRARPDTMINPDMPTGEVEVLAENIVVLNKSEVPPFTIDEASKANEDLRLKYRFLDLRTPTMQHKIQLRSDVSFAIREYLIGQGFMEIETPTFVRSTPEGARDYLVPSRLYAGKFYALPQSPQLYKQILMVSGCDKYFQIARCYRDEDARGDRQPEFTQIDIEESFVSREDILALAEGMMGYVFKKTMDITLPANFVRLAWDEAQEKYGTDKPDLRFGMEMQDFAPYVEAEASSETGGFLAFKDALAAGGAVKALVVPGDKIAAVNKGQPFSRKQIEDIEATAKIYKAKGMAWMRVTPLAGGTEGGATLEGGVSKYFTANAGEIIAGLGAYMERMGFTRLGEITLAR
jgi:aspartyl-tRNA synthetase